jgi:glycerol-3-phosphate dehydrogenase
LANQEPFDVLVVGGGIVGSGIARDAAMRGLRTALVDKHDFAFGTSSRSSRLLHGGLRYLAQGRVGLVHEASVEKMIIHRIAPHLADPLPFIFPTRSGTPWKYWKMRMGVKVYDLLCGGRNLGKSSGMSKARAAEVLPGLNEQGLTGAVRYYDGLTNDARLVLDTMRSAAAAGAVVCNYAALEHAVRDGAVWRCRVVDRVTGKTVDLAARSVVNAGGAWAMNFAASKVKLRLTKGVHLVIRRDRLPIPDAVVMAEGKRILFAIPWGDRVILGTTDTDYAGATESPTCDEQDVNYVLGVTNFTFVDAKLTKDDVISAWSGLRPLIADPNGRPSDISRAHSIQMTEPGWIDVAGGKLTTYRLMAEQTVDRIVKHTGAKARACETATTPLLAFEGADGSQASRLNGEGAKPKYSAIVPVEVSKEAVEHFCRNEWALHLDDVMVRRSSWRYYHKNQLEIAERVAGWMAECLGWDEATKRYELERYTGQTSSPTAICGPRDDDGKILRGTGRREVVGRAVG